MGESCWSCNTSGRMCDKKLTGLIDVQFSSEAVRTYSPQSDQKRTSIGSELSNADYARSRSLSACRMLCSGSEYLSREVMDVDCAM